MFLSGVGGAVLALPMLESLLAREAAAEVPAAPKRFIALKSFSTQLVKEWHPSFQGNGYQLHDARYSDKKADGTTLLTASLGGGPYTQAPLADLRTNNGLSGILGANLNPFLAKLTLIRGLDFLPQVNHNWGGLLGNYNSCTNATPCPTASGAERMATIDQVLAYSKKFYPTTPGARALHISQGVTDSMSFSDGGVPGGPLAQQPCRTNPLDAFNDLFALFTPPTPSGAPPAPGRDKLIVDRVREDYLRLRQNPRLSSADRQLAEGYVNLITELQAKLSTTPLLSCTAPAKPGSLANNVGTDPGDIKRRWDIFLDIIEAAIKCDRTRLITIAMHKALGPGPDPNNAALFGYYHNESDGGGTWHGLAHDFGNPNSRRILKGINAWIANEFLAKLLARLDVPESNGKTYLDNSLVYWGNELGFNHIAYSVPCLLAGSAGGFLKTGRYLDYVDWNGKLYFDQEDGCVIKGIPHNRLLVTILQAMGLSPADYEVAGRKGYGSTNTNGKSPAAWPVDYDLNAIGNILPGINA